MSKIKTIGRNIRFMGLSQFISVVISFFLFPFVVGHVGKEVYGVYLIVVTVTGYFGIFDFGVMSALTKYVSEYNGKGDREGMVKIINASFSFYVLFGIIIALILFACSMYFHLFLKIAPANIATVKQLFVAAGVSAFFIWPLSAFRGIIQGLNLWDADAILSMVTQVLLVIATIFLFSF